MTDFHVEVVRINNLVKHPNADSLSIVNIGAYPVIVRTADWNIGDLAVYVPEDSVVPLEDPRFSFLEKGRVRAKKLRGVFSCGLLVPADPGMNEGDDVAEKLGITKYLTPQERHELGVVQRIGKKQRKNKDRPKYMPRYASVENLRRNPHAFAEGEEVIIDEKIEGENAFYAFNHHNWWGRIRSWLGIKVPRVLCSSRNELKEAGPWFDIIGRFNLEKKFLRLDDPEAYTIYGESYGYFPGFNYGTNGIGQFLVFDVYDRYMGKYLDRDDAKTVCQAMGLRMAPELYRGPFSMEIVEKLANEPSVLGKHIKEGVIVRSVTEQFGPSDGRKLLKYKCEAYLTRND